jgi:hypothetical protein
MLRKWTIPTLALSAALLCGGSLSAADAKKPEKATASFGLLQAPAPEAAKAQAQDWLKATGKMNEKAFDAIWASDRTILEKVADTLALGDEDAAKILAEVRDANQPAPTALPALLKDAKKPAYLRANLALAYGKALAGRKVNDEALDAFKTIKAEDVVDPAAYYFHRAVVEHALMMKKEANDSIFHLLDDVSDSPERYKMVAALMHFDMLAWKDKDLGWIARKMDLVKDRLELTRGGPKTQKHQREIVLRLEEMVKELENKGSGAGSGNGGNCPGGGSPGLPSGSIPSGTPAADSALPSGQNKGEVDMKKVKEIAEIWGKLPPGKQAEAMVELTRDLPPKYREAIERYVKEIQSRSADEIKK